MTTAIITGGSRGFGRALAEALVDDGWTVIIDGRDIDAVLVAAAQLGPNVIPVPGDVTDAAHREPARRRRRAAGGLDLLVNNASALGPVAAAGARGLPARRARRRRSAINVGRSAGADPAGAAAAASSAATVHRQHHLRRRASRPTKAGAATARRRRRSSSSSNVLAAEEPDVRVYWFDPGDMRTADAPGRVPRRGHLRPAAARDGRVPAFLPPARRTGPTAAVRAARASSRRWRDDRAERRGPSGRRSTCRRSSRPASRPRRAACRATPCG